MRLFNYVHADQILPSSLKLGCGATPIGCPPRAQPWRPTAQAAPISEQGPPIPAML